MVWELWCGNIRDLVGRLSQCTRNCSVRWLGGERVTMFPLKRDAKKRQEFSNYIHWLKRHQRKTHPQQTNQNIQKKERDKHFEATQKKSGGPPCFPPWNDGKHGRIAAGEAHWYDWYPLVNCYITHDGSVCMVYMLTKLGLLLMVNVDPLIWHTDPDP